MQQRGGALLVVPRCDVQGVIRTITGDSAPHPEVFPEGGVVDFGPRANYPAPTLLGSPFTNLGVTQSYFSLLHCEPDEHPFNFITWLDVLSGGSEMEVSRVDRSLKITLRMLYYQDLP